MTDELFATLNYAAQNRCNKLEIIRRLLLSNDILCIDGLEKERYSDAAKENLFLIINKAYFGCRRLIITTNFSPDAIKELDERVYSRLIQMSVILIFNWKDYRTKENEGNESRQRLIREDLTVGPPKGILLPENISEGISK